MRGVWCALALAATAGSASAAQVRPVWKVNLTADYQFRQFGLAKHSRSRQSPQWKNQEDVVFISPDILAVYQVLESEGVQPASPRSASGGAGRYILQVVFLDAKNGKPVRTLRFVTPGSQNSKVWPTHEGKFLVQTGALVRVYSASFEETASRSLPTRPDSTGEGIALDIVPPGKYVYVEHSWNTGRSGAWGLDHYLLDSDTLATLEHPRPSDVAFWNSGNVLFRPSGTSPGVFTDRGDWLTLRFGPTNDCGVRFVFEGVPGGGPGGHDCKQINVFSRDGQTRWSVHAEKGVIGSFVSNGSLLAVAVYRQRANPLDLQLCPDPLGVTVYDLDSKAERLSIPFRREKHDDVCPLIFYDLSVAGGLAVIQGYDLSFYAS